MNRSVEVPGKQAIFSDVIDRLCGNTGLTR